MARSYGPLQYRSPPNFGEMHYRGRDRRARYRRRLAAWDLTGGYCWYCREPLSWFGGVQENGIFVFAFELDHKHPRAFGGSNAGENIAPACQSCNASKGCTLDWSPDLQKIRHGQRRLAG